MGWHISSCFDCKLLKERGRAFYCQHYGVELSYDIARTVNSCEFKQPFDEQPSSRDKILERLYEQCCAFSENVLGPFTARELVLASDYKNKNSLWQMLEELVRRGKLRKGKMQVANRFGHVYRANVYFPVLPAERRPGILSSAANRENIA